MPLTPPGRIALTVRTVQSIGGVRAGTTELSWDEEVKGQSTGGWTKVRPGPEKGQKFPSSVGFQCPGRKIEPGDKVRILPQALPEAQPAELSVEIPENYGGNFPLYLTKLLLPREGAEGQIVLSGDSGKAAQGPFAMDPDSGFLLVTRALDREEQAEYQLQVWLGQVWGSAGKAGPDADSPFLPGHPGDTG